MLLPLHIGANKNDLHPSMNVPLDKDPKDAQLRQSEPRHYFYIEGNHTFVLHKLMKLMKVYLYQFLLKI